MSNTWICPEYLGYFRNGSNNSHGVSINSPRVRPWESTRNSECEIQTTSVLDDMETASASVHWLSHWHVISKHSPQNYWRHCVRTREVSITGFIQEGSRENNPKLAFVDGKGIQCRLQGYDTTWPWKEEHTASVFSAEHWDSTFPRSVTRRQVQGAP